MAQVRLLVPWTDDKGKSHAADEVVNVSDEVFTQLRADGKASATADEDAAAKRATEGNYGARTSRADAGQEAAPEAPKESKKK